MFHIYVGPKGHVARRVLKTESFDDAKSQIETSAKEPELFYLCLRYSGNVWATWTRESVDSPWRLATAARGQENLPAAEIQI
jgi:hypothetical protein